MQLIPDKSNPQLLEFRANLNQPKFASYYCNSTLGYSNPW